MNDLRTLPRLAQGSQPLNSDSLPQILAFVYAVRHGGFAAAGRRLGLTASAVGKSVARLERALGVTLLHRTTRSITLTDIGEGIYERYGEALRLLKDADLMALQEASLLTGTLRLDLPRVYGARVIGPMLARFAEQHPLLGMDIRLNDEICNLVAEGIDLAVRIGEVAESRLVARVLDQQYLVIVASPGYLERHGCPSQPEDLKHHQCLGFRHASHGRIRPWQFRMEDTVTHLTLEHRYLFDEGIALKRAAETGFGVIQVPSYMVRRAVSEGTLQTILGDYQPEPTPISLVYPGQTRHSPKIRALVEFLLLESSAGRLGPDGTQRVGF